jgi:hypothetical protein
MHLICMHSARQNKKIDFHPLQFPKFPGFLDPLRIDLSNDFLADEQICVADFANSWVFFDIGPFHISRFDLTRR